MGASGPSGGGGGGGPNTGPAGQTGTTVVAGKTYKTYGTKKDAEDANLKNFARSRKNKVKDTKIVGSLGVLKGPLSEGAEYTAEFFTNKVLASDKAKKNIGYTRSEFASLSSRQKDKVYSDYMDKRTSGETDAYGNINPGFNKDDGGNNQPAQETIIKKNVGGTEVQTTQAKIDEQRAKDDEYDIRKVKKRGRRRNILTSSKGVTTVSPDYSLGKPSLLGSV
jgi:hypothetical protein